MKWHKDTLEIPTRGKGLYPFTELIQYRLRGWAAAEGMCFLYVQHTSASLVISESYDPSAKEDLEKYMEKTVPENLAWYAHTLEGADDSPSHIRSMLTNTSLAIPVDEGRLSLGMWQGVYLFEHRSVAQRRNVLMRYLEI